MASIKKQAKRVAKKGRRGDSQLLHVSKSELMGLMGTGRITKNPYTGLPEAFNLGHFISEAAKNNPDPLNPSSGKVGSELEILRNPTLASPSNVQGNPNETPLDIGALGPSFAQDPNARMYGRDVGLGFAGWGIGEGIGAVLGGGGGYATPADADDAAATGGGVGGGAGTGTGAAPLFDPSVDSSPTATGDTGSSSPFFSGDPNPVPSFGGGGEGMGFPGEGTTDGSIPGNPGGPGTGAGDMDFWDRLKGFGNYFPSLKQTGNALQIGGGAYGLYNSYEGRQAQKQQQKQQQSYFDQLNNLMNNPGQVTSDPGYQFNLDQGSKALARRMASMGYGSSGNLALATQQYGQNYALEALGQREQLLASQYGRAQPPTRAMPDPTELAMRSLSNMGYGFGGA